MSVSISGLSKIYGTQRAVDNISFEAKPGEILGFLGPNGAGKSTTMKIITCFIPATAGQVKVCGHDTETEAMEVRRQIGYLPEHNPLYREMYVKEYLDFVARMYRLGNRRQKVQEMIEITGLGREQHKRIQQLSKGYRQRVGLAQAMINDPKVLILDEPTSGLDPNQLAEIRQLIKQIGKEKTVILSTHIMQEVKALCDRVIIINKGKLVANDDIASLTSQSQGKTIVEVEFLKVPTLDAFQKIEGIENVKKLADNKVAFSFDQQADPREKIFNCAVESGAVIIGMVKEESSVEDVFKELTNK